MNQSRSKNGKHFFPVLDWRQAHTLFLYSKDSEERCAKNKVWNDWKAKNIFVTIQSILNSTLCDSEKCNDKEDYEKIM